MKGMITSQVEFRQCRVLPCWQRIISLIHLHSLPSVLISTLFTSIIMVAESCSKPSIHSGSRLVAREECLVVQHFGMFCPLQTGHVMLCGLQIRARRQALALPFFLPEIELPFPIASSSSSGPEHFRFRLCRCWCWRQSAPAQSIQGGNYPNQPQLEVAKLLKFCVAFGKFTAMMKFIMHSARNLKSKCQRNTRKCPVTIYEKSYLNYFFKPTYIYNGGKNQNKSRTW